MQLFVFDKGYMYIHPMKAKTEIIDAVKAFAKEIVVHTALILDPSGEQRLKVFKIRRKLQKLYVIVE